MKYNYAVVDEFGRCYLLLMATFYICDRLHIPIEADGQISVEMANKKYLSKYYWPLPEFADFDTDFVGERYADALHTIKEA